MLRGHSKRVGGSHSPGFLGSTMHLKMDPRVITSSNFCLATTSPLMWPQSVDEVHGLARQVDTLGLYVHVITFHYTMAAMSVWS